MKLEQWLLKWKIKNKIRHYQRELKKLEVNPNKIQEYNTDGLMTSEKYTTFCKNVDEFFKKEREKMDAEMLKMWQQMK
jgi:hypothetical protein